MQWQQVWVDPCRWICPMNVIRIWHSQNYWSCPRAWWTHQLPLLFPLPPFPHPLPSTAGTLFCWPTMVSLGCSATHQHFTALMRPCLLTEHMYLRHWRWIGLVHAIKSYKIRSCCSRYGRQQGLPLSLFYSSVLTSILSLFCSSYLTSILRMCERVSIHTHMWACVCAHTRVWLVHLRRTCWCFIFNLQKCLLFDTQ